IQKIDVESPIAHRRAVINTGTLPKAGGDLAVKQHHHRAVVGQGVAAPVFQETREVFHAAAIGTGGGLHDAGQERGVDGGAAGILVVALAAGGVLVVQPAVGQHGDRVGNQGGRFRVDCTRAAGGAGRILRVKIAFNI